MSENQPMTEAMYYILLSLLRPGHGYGMMQRITEISAGRIHMGPGTLYGVLNRMKREGFIVLESQDERRKTYMITPLGKQALQDEYERLVRLVEDGRTAGVSSEEEEL